MGEQESGSLHVTVIYYLYADFYIYTHYICDFDIFQLFFCVYVYAVYVNGTC